MKRKYTLQELFLNGMNTLKNAGIEEARLDAWLLLEYETKRNRAYYLAHMEEPVEQDIAQRYLRCIGRRAKHVPLQHLTHQAFFMGQEFYVNEDVLIPRQDTEIVVEKALQLLNQEEAPEVLDMCTGSGCILLSMLCEKAKATGIGVDISEPALAVARRNAALCKTGDRARFVQSDLFDSDFFCGKSGIEQPVYDMLISNPPYIASGEIHTLMEEVRLHDPRMALDGKEDGLYFYREITGNAMKYLKEGGWLVYEIGCDQGEDVCRILIENGFTDVTAEKDLAGLDRVAFGRKSKGVESCYILPQ
ncbi:MAG: peptide chain release factor N(5)-glutamine methyltransferase [Blautia sp.]|nr:peptide chain release factor N(5)-glutamine methyltransferase [Blautia sp.]